MKVLIETVIPLSATQKKSVQKLVEQKLGNAEIVEKINPSILGGIRITAGSVQYDASVFGKLQQLRTI